MSDVADAVDMPCFYVLCALLPFPPLPEGGAPTDSEEIFIRVPDGATLVQVASTIVASIGRRVEISNIASQRTQDPSGQAGVAIKLSLREVIEGRFVGCMVDCMSGELQELIDSMAREVASKYPDRSPARHLLRAAISASMRLTHDRYPDTPLAALMPTMQAALEEEAALGMPGVSGVLYAVIIEGTMPVIEIEVPEGGIPS